MSILTQPPAASNGHDKQNGVRTYRGRRLEDLIPKIRAELGPDAIILREREGLMGGVGGFFAQRFVEVEARAGAPQIDVYDDEDDEMAGGLDFDGIETFAAQLEAAATKTAEAPAGDEPEIDTRPEPVAESTAEPIAAPEPVLAPEPVPAPDAIADPEPIAPAEPARPSPAPAPQARRVKARSSRRLGSSKGPRIDGSAAGAVARELIARGVSEAWTHQLISTAAAHRTPFSFDGNLLDAVRATLANSIARAEALPMGGGAVAFVGAGGAGKTRCSAALASAYRRYSTLPVTAISLGGGRTSRSQLTELLRGHDVSVNGSTGGKALARRVQKSREGSLVVIDTEAVAPSDAAAVGAMAAALEPLELDAIYVALPATIGSESGRRLLAGLAPLSPTGIAITHADETDQLGIAIELACASGIPVALLHDGLDLERAMTAPDPHDLATRLLP
jgi:flagellar biosynthesis protein FlhF